VHKAIRRLAPAPKARPTRKESGTDAAVRKTTDEDDLIDLNEPRQMRDKRLGSITAYSDAPAPSSSPKTATFMMRRSSTGPDGNMGNNAVPVKANLDEMWQQLKHLGPSNPATNPKNTRSTAVTIKTGRGGAVAPVILAPSSVPNDIPAAVTERLSDDIDEERSPLLRPKITGKSGVHAVRKSYGSVGGSEAQSRLAGRSIVSSPAPEAMLIDTDPVTVEMGTQTAVSEEPAAIVELPTELVTTSSSEPASKTAEEPIPRPVSESADIVPDLLDTPISTRSQGSIPPRHLKSVRSGSITENIYDHGGVQKIVIETTSSGEEGASTSKSPISPPAVQSLQWTDSAASNATGAAEHESEDEEEEVTSPSEPIASSSNTSKPSGGQGGGKKKNNNRRKKRKGGGTRF
jgi:metal transporter CNNM